jgi:imidazolonepropionase-like amidohydrolase
MFENMRAAQMIHRIRYEELNMLEDAQMFQMATINGARSLHLEDKIGTLEVGKLADIAAWKRDLLTDPKALLDCAFVMKEGVVYQTECTEGLED